MPPRRYTATLHEHHAAAEPHTLRPMRELLAPKKPKREPLVDLATLASCVATAGKLLVGVALVCFPIIAVSLLWTAFESHRAGGATLVVSAVGLGAAWLIVRSFRAIVRRSGHERPGYVSPGEQELLKREGWKS